MASFFPPPSEDVLFGGHGLTVRENNDFDKYARAQRFYFKLCVGLTVRENDDSNKCLRTKRLFNGSTASRCAKVMTTKMMLERRGLFHCVTA